MASRASTSPSTRPRANGRASSPSRRSTSSSTTCARPSRCARASGRGSSATGARSKGVRRWSWSAPTRSPRGHRPSRTSTGCSPRCSPSSSRSPRFRQDKLNGRLANGSQAWPIKGRIGQGKGEKSDFWSAVGGQYKVSLDYVVRLSVDSGAALERGPEVRTQTVRTRLSDGPARTVLEMHRSVGRVSEQEGRASRRRLGHPPGCRHLDFERRRRALSLRPPAAGPTPAAGTDGRRPRGRRAARSPGPGSRPGDQVSERVGKDCPNGCLAASGRRSGGPGRLGHGN